MKYIEFLWKSNHKKDCSKINMSIILCITGQLFIVSFYFGGRNFQENKAVMDIYENQNFAESNIIVNVLFSEKNIHECILSNSLLFVYLFCNLLWSNPIKYSIIHRIDGVIAKVSIVYFITYTILCKKMDRTTQYSYYMVVMGIFANAYLSNYYSNKEWCSAAHIYYHALLHIFCFIGSLYAFLLPFY